MRTVAFSFFNRYCFYRAAAGIATDAIVKLIISDLHVVGLAFCETAECPRGGILICDRINGIISELNLLPVAAPALVL